MKRLLVLAIALIVMAGFAGVSFAQEEAPEAVVESAAVVEVLTGNIVSVNAENNEIVVKDDVTGIDRVVEVAPEVTPTLKAGEKVKVTIGEDMAATEVVKVMEKKEEPAPAQGM